jgi:hypothetical protein
MALAQDLKSNEHWHNYCEQGWTATHCKYKGAIIKIEAGMPLRQAHS